MAGAFITFEGTEGSGKSTQIALLARRFRDQNRQVQITREPGGTPLGEKIRDLVKHAPAGVNIAAETELLLMNASRAQLVRELILPSLKAGEIVLCDRFYHSTFAYQGLGRGLDLEMIKNVIQCATGGLKPDLTFYLHVPIETSEARRHHRDPSAAPDRFEQCDRSFFQAVEAGFLEMARQEPSRIRTINASLSMEEVSSLIWESVQEVVAPGSETD